MCIAYTWRQPTLRRWLWTAVCRVGSNASAIKGMLAEAARVPKPATVALQFVAPNQLQVSVTDSGNTKQRVLLAVTEDNLTTNVGAGENGGRVLVHSAVVRELHEVGTISNGHFEKTVNLPDKQDWKRDDCTPLCWFRMPMTTSSGELQAFLILCIALLPPDVKPARRFI